MSEQRHSIHVKLTSKFNVETILILAKTKNICFKAIILDKF